MHPIVEETHFFCVKVFRIHRSFGWRTPRCLRGHLGFPRTPNFQKLWYVYLLKNQHFRFSDMKQIRYKNVPIFLVLLKCFGDKYGVRGSRLGHIFGRSKNDPKIIAICPGVTISHLGIIKTSQKLIIIKN